MEEFITNLVVMVLEDPGAFVLAVVLAIFMAFLLFSRPSGPKT